MENSIGFPITDHDFRIISIFASRVIDCRRNNSFAMSSSIGTFFEKITTGSELFRKIISNDRRNKIFSTDHLLLHHRIEKGNTFLHKNFKTNSFYNTWLQNFIQHKIRKYFLRTHIQVDFQ